MTPRPRCGPRRRTCRRRASPAAWTRPPLGCRRPPRPSRRPGPTPSPRGARDDPPRRPWPRPSSSKVRLDAVGIPAAAITSLANAFDASICAAAAPGPKTARPSARSRSARPRASGTSGPMTVRSMPCMSAASASRSRSSAANGEVGGELRGTGIARRTVEVRVRVLAPERPAERVLPPARADDQQPHDFCAFRKASRARSAARRAASATWLATARASAA